MGWDLRLLTLLRKHMKTSSNQSQFWLNTNLLRKGWIQRLCGLTPGLFEKKLIINLFLFLFFLCQFYCSFEQNKKHSFWRFINQFWGKWGPHYFFHILLESLRGCVIFNSWKIFELKSLSRSSILLLLNWSFRLCFLLRFCWRFLGLNGFFERRLLLFYDKIFFENDFFLLIKFIFAF